MNYYIAVEVVPQGSIAELTKGLQQAYDQGGAAGDFKVLVTRQPTYLVVFQRSVAEDSEYVSERATKPGIDIKTAAMQQLAAELRNVDTIPMVHTMVEDLDDGDAQCFDFGDGALEAMASSPEEVAEAG